MCHLQPCKIVGRIFDAMPTILIGVDLSGKVNYWNKHAEDITGVSNEIALGQVLSEVWSEFDSIDELQKVIESAQICRFRKRFMSLASGKASWDITIFPLREGVVVGAAIKIEDVSEQVQLQEQLIQSEKMVSLGQLAAGMAHEINNPLAGVLQNVQIVRQRLSPHLKINKKVAQQAELSLARMLDYLYQRDIPALLDRVMESGRRATQLIDNMLTFSRRDTGTMQEADLADLIDKAVELATGNYSLLKKFDFRSIEIKREYASNLPLVECNPVQVQQVVLNLLKNGADSMGEKLLQQHNSEAAADYKPRLVLRTAYNETHLVFEIEDNGMGMDDQTQHQLFEPFYTTKNAGEGTGLGLSICYFIVTEVHHGQISVSSQLHSGTTFRIQLPRKRT